MKAPEKLYKYKSLAGNGLDRIIDIIQNNRIYMPLRHELNDLIEGFTMIDPPGVMGGGIHHAAGSLTMPAEEALDRYRILSLSAKPLHEPMWGYYADSCKGVVLEFSGDSFKEFKKIDYITEFDSSAVTLAERDDLDNNAYKALFRKSFGWVGEDEWRLIRKKVLGEFLHFKPSEIKRIIIGSKADNLHVSRMKDICAKYDIALCFQWADRFSGRYIAVKNFDNMGSGAPLELAEGLK